MERIFWIKNGDLREVNEWLQKGWKVKTIQAVCETISSYGYHGSGGTGYTNDEKHGNYVGDIYAYIVLEWT